MTTKGLIEEMMNPEIPDKIEKIGNSLIQYGPYNQRVYILHAEKQDIEALLKLVEKYVDQMKLTKVIGKIPQVCMPSFEEKNFLQEASIPDYYGNGQSAVFASKFYDFNRSIEKKADLIKDVLHIAKEKKAKKNPSELSSSYSFKKMEFDDIFLMAEVYQVVFPSYPFPIYDPDYLKQTMEEGVEYFGVFAGEKLVALSSIEPTPYPQTAEMTDFATLPDFRGKGLAGFLLEFMERYLRKHHSFKMIYTIARAYSYGINTIFSKADYSFGGTLTNNTNIHGQIESMNIWYKKI